MQNNPSAAHPAGQTTENNPDTAANTTEKVSKDRGDKTSAKRKTVIAVLLAVLTGFINGFFGGGGGMICVPLLLYAHKLPVKKAHATALLIILPLSLISGVIYWTFGAADWPLILKAGAGVLAGGTLGAFLLKKLSSNFISCLFAAVMLAAGVKLLFF